MGERVQWCPRPIRVRGRSLRVEPDTGLITSDYDTGDSPAGVHLLACRSRHCPSCGPIYRLQQYLLFRAGLVGGKGVPPSVVFHPAAFATFTAPSFGSVHRRGRCVRHTGVCGHDISRSCPLIHPIDDPILGAPLCGLCFNYRHLVMWNGRVSALWQRSQIQIRRELAALTGISQRRASAIVRLDHAGVLELQRRGAIHRHTIFRLDARTEPGDPLLPPPPPFNDAALLITAIRLGTAKAQVAFPGTIRGVPAFARWGHQVDVSVISSPSRAGDEHDRT